MSDTVLVAVIGGAVAIGAAVIAAWQAVRARRENRVEHLEREIADLVSDNRLMWLWCRELVDHIYRGNPPPPPPAPSDLFKREEHNHG